MRKTMSEVKEKKEKWNAKERKGRGKIRGRIIKREETNGEPRY